MLLQGRRVNKRNYLLPASSENKGKQEKLPAACFFMEEGKREKLPAACFFREEG